MTPKLVTSVRLIVAMCLPKKKNKKNVPHKSLPSEIEIPQRVQARTIDPEEVINFTEEKPKEKPVQGR